MVKSLIYIIDYINALEVFYFDWLNYLSFYDMVKFIPFKKIMLIFISLSIKKDILLYGDV